MGITRIFLVSLVNQQSKYVGKKNKKLKTITGKQPKQRVRIRFIGCRLRLYCWIWFSQAKRNLPLHVASSTGNLPMVKFLLSQDSIHVDEEDCEGMTPILRYLKRNLSVLNKTRERKRHVLLMFWVVSSCDTESCLILRPSCSVVELCAYKNELIWFEGASIEIDTMLLRYSRLCMMLLRYSFTNARFAQYWSLIC